MENIYERYGKLMIQREILDGKIMECKKLIAEELGKKKAKREEDSTEKEKVK